MGLFEKLKGLMLVSLKSIKSIKFVICCLMASLVMTSACGGGTSGSGGRSFQGTVLRASVGTPLQGLKVTVLETGDSDITDEKGFFSIDTDATEDNLTFLLESDDFNGNINVSGLASNTVLIKLEFEVEEAGEDDLVTISGVLEFEDEAADDSISTDLEVEDNSDLIDEDLSAETNTPPTSDSEDLTPESEDASSEETT